MGIAESIHASLKIPNVAVLKSLSYNFCLFAMQKLTTRWRLTPTFNLHLHPVQIFSMTLHVYLYQGCVRKSHFFFFFKCKTYIVFSTVADIIMI